MSLLPNQTTIITGGASGIGSVMAEALYQTHARRCAVGWIPLAKRVGGHVPFAHVFGAR